MCAYTVLLTGPHYQPVVGCVTCVCVYVCMCAVPDRLLGLTDQTVVMCVCVPCVCMSVCVLYLAGPHDQTVVGCVCVCVCVCVLYLARPHDQTVVGCVCVYVCMCAVPCWAARSARGWVYT